MLINSDIKQNMSSSTTTHNSPAAGAGDGSSTVTSTTASHTMAPPTSNSNKNENLHFGTLMDLDELRYSLSNSNNVTVIRLPNENVDRMIITRVDNDLADENGEGTALHPAEAATSTTRDSEHHIPLCRLDLLIPFSRMVQTPAGPRRVTAKQFTTIDAAAAALLAVEHLNTGDG